MLVSGVPGSFPNGSLTDPQRCQADANAGNLGISPLVFSVEEGRVVGHPKKDGRPFL